MTDTFPVSMDSLAFPERLPESPHYLRAVTELAQRRAVVAQEAIYAEGGIKLVEKGTRIDGRLYDRLVQHKLREPIDSHLAAEDTIDHAVLVATAREVARDSPLGQLLGPALGTGFDRMWVSLAQVPLPSTMAFKLTVMREQRPKLFQHSLEMVIVAMFLGLRSALNDNDCIALTAAALLHDVGVLHMPPAWRDPQHKFTGADRKQLVAHPITSMLMLRAAQVYPREVELAVLEHHERMDGTGYPRGLQGADISPLGRILLLAEVVTAFYAKYTEDLPAQQLSLALRLNHRRFPAALVAHVLPLLGQAAPQDAVLQPLAADAPRAIETLARAFAHWETAKVVALSPDPDLDGQGIITFVDERLMALKKILVEAGAHPDQQREMLPLLQDDAASLAEVAFVCREAMWQLQNIANSCLRRWPLTTERRNPIDAAVAQWCDWVLGKL